MWFPVELRLSGLFNGTYARSIFTTETCQRLWDREVETENGSSVWVNVSGSLPVQEEQTLLNLPNHSLPPCHCSVIVPFVCSPKFYDFTVSHLKPFWMWWVNAFNKGKLVSAMSSEQGSSQTKWNPDWLVLELVEEASSITTKTVGFVHFIGKHQEPSLTLLTPVLVLYVGTTLLGPPACTESVRGCVYFILIVGGRKEQRVSKICLE